MSGFAGCHTSRRCCPLLQYYEMITVYLPYVPLVGIKYKVIHLLHEVHVILRRVDVLHKSMQCTIMILISEFNDKTVVLDVMLCSLVKFCHFLTNEWSQSSGSSFMLPPVYYFMRFWHISAEEVGHMETKNLLRFYVYFCPLSYTFQTLCFHSSILVK